MRDVEVVTMPGHPLAHEVRVHTNRFVSDEPVDAGGQDLGPTPHEVLLAALGSCTGMTLRLYARRKGWRLDSVHVTLSGEKVEGELRIRRRIVLSGALSDAERTRLLDIAQKCPVHRTLTGKISIATELSDEVVNPDVGPTS
jgi:putative redox protein